MLPEDDMEDAEEYPWEDVAAARENERLQRRHSVVAAKQNYLAKAKACPRCGAVVDKLAWFYFDSPLETWTTLCGCAGWMTVCDACHVQVDFFLEVMS
jgi:hypothetical protein